MTHLSQLVTHLSQADDAQKRGMADASHAVVSMEDTGRPIASLAQAVRCLNLNLNLNLNHERLAQGHHDKW
ncbi:hypothetical protein B0E54_04499 [Micromonospora sp. MH99]|nr:hypothetical protein [Micromonospora sp. MH99]